MQLFAGEGEAIVNFPHVYVMNQKFGVDFDKAFRQSRGAANYTVDDAAIHRMITENFRNGKPMDKSNTTLDEFRYQARGYAKYADIARLFGWQALKNFWNPRRGFWKTFGILEGVLKTFGILEGALKIFWNPRRGIENPLES